jgi:hypothetical protein
MPSNHVSLIEKKRTDASNKISQWYRNGKISKECFLELLEQNAKLADQLVTIFCKANKLLEEGLLGSLSETLNYRKKPAFHKETFEIMRQMIIEGSENPLIRKTAIQLAEQSSKLRQIPVQVPSVEDLYAELPIKDESKNTLAFIRHCSYVAKDIFSFVREKSVFVSDPPDDFFQDPVVTLGIMDLKGDCDDLAILLCSLYRSIGFRTFLAFLPNHVISGVILAHYSFVNDSAHIDFVEIPTDPQLESLEVNNQNYPKDLFDIIMNPQIIDEVQNKLLMDSFLQKVNYLFKSHIYQIDETIPTMTIVDMLSSISVNLDVRRKIS